MRRYTTFWVNYKEYVVGILTFIAMLFIRSFERSTRPKMADMIAMNSGKTWIVVLCLFALN